MTVVRSIRRRTGARAGDSGDWGALPPLLRRLHAARGSASLQQAQPRLGQLLPPDQLSGMAAAVGLLAAAIGDDRHIVVVGDFDCDGATACALGVRGLRLLGARRVSYAVPDRAVHGYGLSPGLVDDLAALAPDLLVTVDHGIACHAGVAAAKARGWQVLVTDHHLPGATLPAADAIVDPNLPGDGFPSKMLAGVGVMFYVLLALRARLYSCDRPDRESQTAAIHGRTSQDPCDHPDRESQTAAIHGRTIYSGDRPDRGDQTAAIHGRTSHQQLPDLRSLLDLVAVGTVADLVPLDANNRALVAAGLRRLRAGQGCAGLQALAAIAGRDLHTLTTADIGFAIAPRINAAGRLQDMALGIACLLSDDRAQADDIAATLNRINHERRALQQHMTDAAEAALAQVVLDAAMPPVLCLFDAGWHPGVVGLVASRLKERAWRPVFAFAPAEPGSASLRGSARSIPGLHIRDLLAAVDAAQPGLIGKFGGHAMAAGLSLARDDLPRFEAALHVALASRLDPALLAAEVVSDGELQPHEFDHASALALRDGGPWGQGYPEPVFDGHFEVLDWRVVGERHLKLELGLHGQRLNAIEFGGWSGERPPAQVRIAFRLEPDGYRGGEAIQLVVMHREPA